MTPRLHRMVPLAAALAAAVVVLALVLPSAADEPAEPPADEPPAREAAATTAAGGGPWPLPEPESCSPEGGLVGRLGGGLDATAVLPFEPGEVFDLERIDVLRDFLPDFIWEYRERFFFEGMRLEIGPCFRDYGPPAFYTEATARFAGQARLDEEAGLHDYTAGLPFPPASIARDDPRAGMKWLWNAAMRYQAAGFRGKFRMTDLVGRIGRAEPFEGEMFMLHMAHRADRADEDYRAPGARGKDFVAGGLFFEPFAAREYAWRQYRDLDHLNSAGRSDDLHAYLPEWRRVRRLGAAQVEGLYMPSFSVGVVPNQQLASAGGVGGGAAGGIGSAGGVGGVGGTIQNKRSGYEGLVIRPLLYRARVVGLHDVLAPLAATTPAYPANPDRDFGSWGLSFASDRWDLRRALVVEITSRSGTASDQEQSARQILYVDLQTLHPLYAATFDRQDERTNVGMYTYRWSEERPDYPRWPDDESRPVRVLDSVGASFANLAEAGSWRRESWENVGTPPSDREVKRLLSVGELTKRR